MSQPSSRVHPSFSRHDDAEGFSRILFLATLAFAVLALVVLSACPAADGATDGGPVELPANVSDMADTYAALVLATYEDAHAGAADLDVAIDAFIADPTESNLTAAKNAWLAAREPYLLTEVFRFYEGPIDNEEDGPEGLINAWPLDENYIDYTVDDPDGGYIAGDGPIDAATLEGLNEQGGDANIATGFHAIEFLLWGQDLSETGPGERPASDYDVGTAEHAERRALYLETVSDMLVGDLQDMVDAWQPGGDSYAAAFTSADPETQLERVMTGMIVLTGFETGSERLKPALDNQDQEDEHSCFSDNTHRDMIQDVQGVINVWEGQYGSVDGTGVKDVIAELDASIATSITESLHDALAKAEALPVPFDQAIAAGNADGNQKVQDLIDALFVAESHLQEAFRAADLDIPVTE